MYMLYCTVIFRFNPLDALTMRCLNAWGVGGCFVGGWTLHDNRTERDLQLISRLPPTRTRTNHHNHLHHFANSSPNYNRVSQQIDESVR